MSKTRIFARGASLGGVLALGAALAVGTAGPAQALDTYGSQTQSVHDPLLTWIILVGAPLAVIAVIALLVLAPTWTQSGRYNPGAGWFAEPMWVGQPDAEAPAALAASAASTDIAVADPGGVSASW